MKNLSLLLRDKTIGVWGMGYLAYTYMLQLQANDFRVRLFDLSEENLKHYRKGRYPIPEQRHIWSATGQMPSLDFSNIEVVSEPDQMFSDRVHVHIICLPSRYLDGTYNANLLKVAEIFQRNSSQAHFPIVVFQSVSGPGSVQRDFEERLGEAKNRYLIGSAFRSDWSLEEFLSTRGEQIVAGTSEQASELIQELYRLMGKKTKTVGTLKEAEFLENASNALEFVVCAYLNELSRAYPGIDVSKLSPSIINGSRLSKCTPGLGTGGFRMPIAIDNLIRESPYSDHLSFLNEGSDINLSSMMLYVDYIKRKGYSKVLLLGVKSAQELILSPALVIAESLLKLGVGVGLHAPSHAPSKLVSMVPGSTYFEFPNDDFSRFDVVVLVSDFPAYRMVSQDFIEEKIQDKLSLVIDNCGLWSRFTFSSGTRYHRVGDGSLDLMS